MGIIEESQVPDKYFCEECRPKLHELHTDSRGCVQISSILLSICSRACHAMSLQPLRWQEWRCVERAGYNGLPFGVT